MKIKFDCFECGITIIADSKELVKRVVRKRGDILESYDHYHYKFGSKYIVLRDIKLPTVKCPSCSKIVPAVDEFSEEDLIYNDGNEISNNVRPV